MASPHPNYYSGLFTLTNAANYNLETDIIPVVAPGMISSLKEFQWRPYTGGPVAKSSSVMAAVTDGPQYAIGEAVPREAGPGPIPANKINFFPTTAGDIIEIVLRTN